MGGLNDSTYRVFNIAGPEDAELKTFYASVFDWEPDQTGQFSIPVVTPIQATIRKAPAGNPMALVEMDGDTHRVTRSGLGNGLAQNQHWLEEEVCENNKNANLAGLPTN